MNEKGAYPIDAPSILHRIPGCHLVLLPDAPRFTIVGATDAYLAATYFKREDIIGQGVFEANTDNPNNPTATGVKNLLASLTEVIELKSQQRMPDQRYDILNPNTGEFEYRVWRPINTPVLDPGNTVLYIVHSVEDITENVRLSEQAKTADQKLQETERRFRSMVEQAPVAILLSRGEDVIIESVNAPMLQCMNKNSAEEVVGKKMTEALPELQGQPVLAAVLNVQKTGIPFRGDEQPVDLSINGKLERHYFNFSYTPVIEAGKISAVLHVAVDVTQHVVARREIEDAKAHAERQQRLYETIHGTIPDLIYVFDLSYRVTYANKALLAVWGRTWEESIGQGLRENGYEEWHAQMHEKEIDKVVATKQPLQGEVSFTHATLGRRIYDYIFAPVINEAGEVEAVAGTTRDVTERRRAEQAIRESEDRFRNLANDSPMFVFIIDPDPSAPVSYWNKAWLQYTGQTFEEAIGTAWNGLIHPDDMPVVMEHYTPAFDDRRPYFIPAVRIKRHDGVYRWHAFKGNPRYLASGEFNGYVGVGFDIHEQKVTEERLEEIVAERTEELQSSNTELQRSNAQLEEFAYAASHDLKEPIRKIRFFSDQLKKQLSTYLREADIHSFGRIENATERMGRLIDDLLLYSHVTHRPHETEEVDLNEKLTLVMEDLELDIQEKGAKIRVEKLPVIKGYRRQLQQVFQNLVSNALKYSKPDVPPEITISAITANEGGALYHVISITDNGIGFEQQYQEKIFQMFSRLHGKSQYGGTGVGLSIVKKVVENHNGFIKVESTPGQGSTFRIFLPVNPPADS